MQVFFHVNAVLLVKDACFCNRQISTKDVNFKALTAYFLINENFPPGSNFIIVDGLPLETTF